VIENIYACHFTVGIAFYFSRD